MWVLFVFMSFIQSKDKVVQLTYSFIFSRRDNIWNSISEFEHDLDKFFMAKGLEAEVITFVEGSSGNRTLVLRPSQLNVPTLKNQGSGSADRPNSKPSSSYTTTQRLTDQINGKK